MIWSIEGWGGGNILRNTGEGAGGGGGGGGAGDGGDKGGTPAPAYEAIPEGPIRDLMASKAYADYPKLADAYYNLNRLHSGAGDVIALPGADAKPEDRAAFYNKVNGVPESVDGYKIEFPEGSKVDDGFVTAAKGWFHARGLRPDQAQGLAEDWQKFMGQQMEQQAAAGKTANETAVTQLRTKYDAKGAGAFDQIIADGQKAVRGLGLSEDQLNRLDAANGVAANLELLAVIGSKMGEGRFVEGAGGGDTSTSSPEAARVEIGKLSADKAFQDSLLDPRNPMHAANTRKWSELQRVGYGKPKK